MQNSSNLRQLSLLTLSAQLMFPAFSLAQSNLVSATLTPLGIQMPQLNLIPLSPIQIGQSVISIPAPVTVMTKQPMVFPATMMPGAADFTDSVVIKVHAKPSRLKFWRWFR